MIRAQGLSRNYGTFAAVKNVSFNIAPGEIVGLLGHNGAGKTTIMKMITGYLEPSAGILEVDNLDIRDKRTEIQNKIGYLPENCPLYLEMTVIDYLQYTAGLRGLDEQESGRAVFDAINRTALNGKATDVMATLSRGYRQRVGVAQAILTKPELLILDEPTNGLDPTQIRQMRGLIKELGEQSTIIISTHILQEVHAVCDRVLIMRNGEVALDTHLDDLQSSQRLHLTIDKTPSEANTVLNKIPGIKSIEFINNEKGKNHYILEVAQNTGDLTEFSAAVASAVIGEGYKLYAIYPEIRDLETVFREINTLTDESTGGQAHAA